MIYFLRVSDNSGRFQWIKYRMAEKPTARLDNLAKIIRNDNEVFEILAQPHDRAYTVQALTEAELLDITHFENPAEQATVLCSFQDMMALRDAGPVRFTARNIRHFMTLIDYCTGKEIKIEE